jgi:hypothetical protein
MSVFVDTVAGRAGNLWHQSVAAIGFQVRSRLGIEPPGHPAGYPVPRGPAMDSAVMIELLEAARTVGKLEWSRRYAEIVGGDSFGSSRTQ